MPWRSSSVNFRRAVALFVCCSLVLFSFVLPAAGCAGGAIQSIAASSLFSKEELVLPISGKNAASDGSKESGYTLFESNETLDEMFSQIQKVPGIHAAKYEGAILLQKSDGDHKDYYCLAKHENHYVFSGMRGIVITDIDASGHKSKSAVLLPVHWIHDPLITEGETPYYTLYAGIEYETAGNADDFEQFYKDSGWYDVSREGETILLSGYQNEDDVVVDPSIDNSALAGSLYLESPILIQVRERDGSHYFTVYMQ